MNKRTRALLRQLLSVSLGSYYPENRRDFDSIMTGDAREKNKKFTLDVDRRTQSFAEVAIA